MESVCSANPDRKAWWLPEAAGQAKKRSTTVGSSSTAKRKVRIRSLATWVSMWRRSSLRSTSAVQREAGTSWSYSPGEGS